jgi:nucleoside-diphosphate-sugar epimerase
MALYVVTGGAGFIGSHLVDALVTRGERVRVVDDFSTGRRENLAHHDAIELLTGDVADPEVARAAVAGADFVLHQGAIPSVPRSVADPVGSHRANVDATVQVLAASREAGVRRVVFAGSSAVYGNLPGLPKHEDMPTAPLTPYALQKLVSEQYCRMFTALYGLETVTLRYFNVFGPRQDPSSPYSGVISLFITALVEGRRPTIFGDGEQTRDFAYVADVVQAVLRACVAEGAGGGVFNVSTGMRVSLNTLFATLREVVGADVTPIHEAPRTGDVRDSQADIGRARAVLGYEPAVPFDEGLRRTVAWYRRDMTTLA